MFSASRVLDKEIKTIITEVARVIDYRSNSILITFAISIANIDQYFSIKLAIILCLMTKALNTNFTSRLYSALKAHQKAPSKRLQLVEHESKRLPKYILVVFCWMRSPLLKTIQGRSVECRMRYNVAHRQKQASKIAQQIPPVTTTVESSSQLLSFCTKIFVISHAKIELKVPPIKKYLNKLPTLGT